MMVHKSKSAVDSGCILHLGDRGRLVLPSRLRKRLGWKTGDELVLMVEDDGGIRLASLREQLYQVEGMYASVSPERRLSDELIQERKEENRRRS